MKGTRRALTVGPLSLSLALIGTAAILAGCGSAGGAAPAARTPSTIGGTSHHSNLPINPPDPSKTATVPDRFTLQLGSNAPVSVGQASEVLLSDRPESITFSNVEAGNQLQDYRALYELHQKGSPAVSPRDMTLQATIDGQTHTYALLSAIVSAISLSFKQGSTTIPSITVYAQSVRRTS